MRKIIICNIVSIDGYFEGPGNNVMDLFSYRLETYPEDESFDSYNAERLRSADTLLLGRRTYEQFRGYWPFPENDPTAPGIERETSRLMNAIDKIVISDSLNAAQTRPWDATTTILRRADCGEKIRELKRREGGEILVFGSRTLWNDLLRKELVDELHLLICPVLLGSGTPVFQGSPPACLRLIDTLTWKGSGIVLARYVVSGGLW